jgi:murein DD-endopeptidase MepM/ murein hydrolase activator NlpD
VSNHRAIGRAQVRPLRRSTAAHRDSAFQAGVVKVGVVGALATATIAVPLASATAAGAPGNLPLAQVKAPTGVSALQAKTGRAAAVAPVQLPTASLTSQVGADVPTVVVGEVPEDPEAPETKEVAAEETGDLDVKAAPEETAEVDGTATSGETAEGADGYIWPVNAPITSGYGGRYHPVLGVYKGHQGVDLGASCGTPVKAAKGGTVVAVEYNSSSGNRVKIDHGNGVITGYYHLQSFNTSVGATVAQGDVVGYVGSTGTSTGCHLHFAKMDASGTYSNPMSLLGQ